MGSAISSFSKGDIGVGIEKLFCGGVLGYVLPDCSDEVDTFQWLAGIGEMIGGGVMGVFGTIELGESILTGGGTLGLGLGMVMVGGGAFLLGDGYFRSSDPNYTFEKTLDLGKAIIELGGGGFLFMKGVGSAYETYNGETFSYFEGGLALVGLAGGGYLLYDGYQRLIGIIYPNYWLQANDETLCGVGDMMGSNGGAFGFLFGNLKGVNDENQKILDKVNKCKNAKIKDDKDIQKAQGKEDPAKKAVKDFIDRFGGPGTADKYQDIQKDITGKLGLGLIAASKNTGGEVSLKDLPTGRKRGKGRKG